MPAQSLQLCPTLRSPTDRSPPGSCIHGILQARKLEWVAISSSRGSSLPLDWAWVSCIASRFFTLWATREALTLTNFLAHTYLFSERSPGKSPHPSSPPSLEKYIIMKAIPAALEKSELYGTYTLIYTHIKLYKVYIDTFIQIIL